MPWCNKQAGDPRASLRAARRTAANPSKERAHTPGGARASGDRLQAMPPTSLRPMLASLADAPLDDPQLVYEPKYDGIRAIVDLAPSGGVRLWSRLGNEKTAQFPEIAAALRTRARHLKSAVVIDGEIVALDASGEPAGFQQLQERIHLSSLDGGREPRGGGVAFIAFDVLREGTTDLRRRTLFERRAVLERLLGRTGSPLLRLSEIALGDGRAMYRRAVARGWEGLVAKRANSRYQSGKRTTDWRKLKIVREQEFVIGGWTEPRHSREHFGALLLGVYDTRPEARGLKAGARSLKPDLIYTGHTGTGFSERELRRVMRLLQPLETRECPFRERPATNEKPHWVRPALVAEIKFTEWTADGRLRHPVYLALRDDKRPQDVHRETTRRLDVQTTSRLGSTGRLQPDTTADDAQRGPVPASLLDQLHAIEDSRRDDFVTLPDGDRLKVGNLHKVFWPKQKLTKGDLMRYYVQIAPCVLPAVDERPLVMKRFPNGIAGKAFYQQRAPDDAPSSVRVEIVRVDGEGGVRHHSETRPRRVDDALPRMVGGGLKTLLYMTQLAAISQDPWFSRVRSPLYADHAALDLDPVPGVAFARVLEVARWIRDELDSLGATAWPKTSGADGLHIYIPLPPETPSEAGLLFCQIVATVVAHKHPSAATTERAVRARGKRVYIDYLQNIVGKTLATAYSARASAYAGVSTPLTWGEVEDGVAREDFTISTVPSRVGGHGDLWKALRTSKGIDLSRVSRYAEGTAHANTPTARHRHS